MPNIGPILSSAHLEVVEAYCIRDRTEVPWPEAHQTTLANMAKRHRTNKAILAGLGLSDEALISLCKATQARVKWIRGMEPKQMDSDEYVRSISEEWLKGNGDIYFAERKSRVLWPRDSQVLTLTIAELMSAQNSNIEKREGPQTGKRILQEASGLITWANQQPKRLRTQHDNQPKYGEESATEYAATSCNETSSIFSESPDTIRASYIVGLGRKKDSDSDWAKSNTTTAKQDIGRYPSQQPLHTSNHDYQTPSNTPALTSPFKPRRYARHGEILATPLPPPHDHQPRSVSECTDRTLEHGTFQIDFAGKDHRLSSEKCANVLQLVLLLLEQMKVELKVAAQQRRAFDGQAKVAHLFRQIEEELKR